MADSAPWLELRGLRIAVEPALPLALGYVTWSLGDRLGGGAAIAVALGVGTGALLRAAARVYAARLAGARIEALDVTLLAQRVALASSDESDRARVGIALASPGLCLLLGALGLALAPREAPALGMLAWIHLGWGAAQLCPVFPLDGGHLLYGLAARHVGAQAAAHFVVTLGRALAGCALAVAIVHRQLPFLLAALYLFAGAQEAHNRPHPAGCRVDET